MCICVGVGYHVWCSSSFLSYPEQYQGCAEICLPSLLIQRFSGRIIRRFTHSEGNSMVGPLFLNGRIRNRWGCCERQTFCPNWESDQEPRGPICYPLSYRFTLVRVWLSGLLTLGCCLSWVLTLLGGASSGCRLSGKCALLGADSPGCWLPVFSF